MKTIMGIEIKKGIKIAIGILILVGILVWGGGFWGRGDDGGQGDNSEGIFDRLGSGWLKGNVGSQSDDKKDVISNDPQNFTHPDFGFSFTYPPGYKLSIIEEGEAESILVQRGGSGMQIYIAPYEGPTINSSLVKKDITDVKVENLNDIEMRSGIRAVAFSYEDPSLGEVWNVWFSAKSSGEDTKNRLYQVTAQTGQDEVVKMFVESFRFE